MPNRTVGQVLETDEARPLDGMIQVGFAQEFYDTGTLVFPSISPSTTVTVGRVFELDLAEDIFNGNVDVPQVVETDTANDITPFISVILIEPVYRASAVFGPVSATTEGMLIDPISIVVHDRSDPINNGSYIAFSRARQFRDDLNDAGSFQFALDRGDSDLALLTEDMLVRFWVAGTPAFDGIIEQVAYTTLAAGEEHDQIAGFQGRGKIKMLEEGAVYPTLPLGAIPVEEDRTFNWTSKSYNDAAWGYAPELVRQDMASGLWGGSIDGKFYPFDWIDNEAFWLWPTSGDQINAPIGTCYFRRLLNFPATGFYRFEFAGSFYGDLWLDTIHQGSTYTGGKNNFLKVSAGVHQLAMVGLVDGETIDPSGAHPGGIIWSVSPCDENGNITGPPIFHSDSNTLMLPYVPQPSMTIGQIIRVVFTEAMLRGAIPLINFTFSDTADSFGRAWTETVLVSTKVGTDLLSLLKQLSQTYVDFWMPPGSYDLYVASKGARGTTRSVNLHAPMNTLSPATGNIVSLTHKRTI